MRDIVARVVYRNQAAGLPATEATIPASTSLHAIAVSAARLLFRSPAECTFAYYTNDPDDRVYLQAVTPDACAIVGPLPTRRPPRSMPKVRSMPLGELLAHVAAAPTRGDYVVHLKYDRIPRAPRRTRGMTDDEYTDALAAHQAEIARLQQRRTIWSVRYAVEPQHWEAADLERFFGLLLSVLPQQETIWGVNLEPENWRGSELKRKHVGYVLVLRGCDYEARVRIPVVPAAALATWLSERDFRVDLKVPEAALRRAVVEQALTASSSPKRDS